ncbi:LysR family transcriptional regulator [Streptomyces galbus]|uniref:LysR family transcriptional regulator n=1 Tax=Streptomyces galbus TaxID=33898 RepID=UPI00382E2254
MRSLNVEIRHLRAFVTVSELMNFTRAAERLRIAQPSLSHTIRQLEAHLGFPLFVRTTRATALTSDGEQFLTEAQEVLKRFDAAMGQAARIAEGELGQLRVGYLIGTAVAHVPAILRAFAELYPEVTVELTEYDFASPNGGLDKGETDVALVRPPLDGLTDMAMTVLLSEPCVACVSEQHPFALQTAVTVSQVLAEPIVAAPGDNAWRDFWILRAYRETPAVVAYEAATFEAEMQAVAIGRGLSVVPASVAHLYARHGVRFVPIEGMGGCQVAAAHRRDAPRAAFNFARVAQETVQMAAS